MCQGRSWGGKAKGGGAPLNKTPPHTVQHTQPNFRYLCSSFKMVAFEDLGEK